VSRAGPRVAVTVAVLAVAGCTGGGGEVLLATTTSTRDSGLLDELLPAFEASSDCEVTTLAVGSGQAMTLGERGDVDVLLVHSPAAEEEFMAAGHGSRRLPVMHNDFVVVGPPEDPAGVAGAADAAEALSRIAAAGATFASRGDDSGTHARELALWAETGVRPAGESYVVTGQGMGETLTIADQLRAYTLADRGTHLATRTRATAVVHEGSDDLRNDYHVIVVDHGGETADCAERFARWVTDTEAQETIAGFGVARYGEPLFVPDATP
jgi:tungstate transport system substrate-binding protein